MNTEDSPEIPYQRFENSVNCRVEQNIGILTITGDFIVSETRHVSEYSEPLLKDPAIRGFIVNLNCLNRIDSSGIGMLIHWLNQGNQRPFKVLLCGVRESLIGFFETVGLDQVLPFYPSEAEAFANFDLAPDAPELIERENPLEKPEIF